MGIFNFEGVRPAGREHIPIYPSYYRTIRGLQLIVTIIVLGLDAYGLSILSFSGDELMMFTCVASIIVSIYFIVAFFAAPAIFNYWALLGLDILLVIFWLVSFALLASQVAPYMRSYTYCSFGYCYNYSLSGAERTYANCLAAAAGLGGLNFLLYCFALAIDSLALMSHRKEGLHCVPGQGSDPEKAANAAVAPAPSATPAPVPLQPVNPVPYYEQQAVAAPGPAPVAPEQQQQYYAAQSVSPPQQQPTPVSYVQQDPAQAADPNAAAYYAAQQQAPVQAPVQQQAPQQHQYHEAPVQPQQ